MTTNKFGIGILSLVSIALLLLSACRDEAKISDLPIVYFETDVKPIITANCTMCHDDMGSYSQVMGYVTAGKPHQSELYQVITNPWGMLRMPEGKAPLTQNQRSTINLWILQGALQNAQ
jgi:hypothetical protein